MKNSIFALLLCFFFNESQGQGPAWQATSVDNILTFKLPPNSKSFSESFMKIFEGELDSSYFTLQYFDTVFRIINTAKDFDISLKGFITGVGSDSSFKGYSALVIDTSIGNTNGLFARFSTADPSKVYKQVFYYVTMANNKFFSFHIYCPFFERTRQNMDYFFKSISFDREKIKEKDYKLPSILIKNERL